MNTSFRFLILTIFISLGFITSCNDDEMTSAEEEKSIVNDTTNVASTPTEPPPYDDEEIDKINPEDLSRQIKEIGEKIEKLEKESTRHFDEYTQMAEFQKKILGEIRRKKMIMRSKPVGSEEQKKAQKDFEDEKKYGKEKLQILKEKNILLHRLTKSITEAKKEQMELQKKQDYFLKRQKEKQEKEKQEKEKQEKENKKTKKN
ncbi:hypothetical protein [Blattabacterium cuenoti]|uniref:Lipoprotein n=1 Tax=Blattabacterium cuenoti BPAY TaxID=1457031 RepID=A0ABN5V3Z1_9FLAO|nr:hypothetical protein [Blattabacterium cuenoti]BAR91950.1 hypothetical protein BPAY_198 [Blattabacterium cuenoti BPAY]